MKKTPIQWKALYSGSEFKSKYEYKEHDLGAVWSKEKTTFKLWSPYAEEVKLNLYPEGLSEKPMAVYPMERKEKGVWEIEIEKDLDRVYYDYTLIIEGGRIRSADPYAKACGCNGKRSMVIDLKKTDPLGWENDKAPEKTPEEIIYEVHVKDFSWDKSGGFPENCRGKYQAFLYPETTLNNNGRQATGLWWMKNLGITHVQLMPVYDYGSVDEMGDEKQFNWGYDPVNYNVPEGSYSSDPFHGEVRIRELKEAIQSLHKQGFRVIMDVVYNHTYSLNSWFQKTAPWYFYRVNEDGTPSNGSACGNDVASERAMCHEYILNSVLYWAEEYHMDGFRFDLMGLLDTKLMNQIRTSLDQIYGEGEKILYGEPWAASETAMEAGFCQALKKNVGLLDKNIGIFSDDTRDTIKGDVFLLDEAGFVNGKTKLEKKILQAAGAWQAAEEYQIKAPSQIITYVSSHDNQTLWDKLCETTKDEERRRKEYRLAAAIYMTCQGRLFFLSGEEFLRTKEGMEDSYNAPISINRLDWERAWKEWKTAEFYQGMIELRKQLPGLCDKSMTAGKRISGAWKKAGLVGFSVDNLSSEMHSPWKRLHIIYNQNDEDKSVRIPAGNWQLLANEEDSMWWKNPVLIEEKVLVRGIGFCVLGQK